MAASDGSSRRVWSIPAEMPFLDTLVAGIVARHGADPLSLAAIRIILPTRRAVRGLSDAFLRAFGGRALLLPRLSALGDVDADEITLAGPADLGDTLDVPGAMPMLRRRFLLGELIRRWGEKRGGDGIPPAKALALAGELGRLLDQVTTEGASLDRLADLAPLDLARHWEITVEFLSILRDGWPQLLAIDGRIDAADRRNRLVAAQLALWRSRPPAEPVIAAGFAGTVPAVADLLSAVADLEAGAVVLPGLDRFADEALWAATLDDPTHPQHGMAHLLARLDVPREAVALWPPSFEALRQSPREILARETTRPAATTDQWRALPPLPEGALDGLARLDLTGPQEEAQTIAALLRAQLERPAATAMLVTPDRSLARRVAVELRRWRIEIDDSGGRKLSHTPPGLFLRAISEAAREALAPVPLLAMLKHPLAALGGPPGQLREQVRSFELAVLRGPRPAPGPQGLETAATERSHLALIGRLKGAVGSFAALVASRAVTLEALVTAHIAAGEALAATDAEPGATRLWAQEAGEALASFMAELLDAVRGLPPVAGADYPLLFEAALADGVVRPRWGRHPRLAILGTLEARLLSADLVILGGLNEGTWPAAASADPWMSRDMRRAFGLPPIEAGIGVAAHDFVQALSGREVVLTRARRVDGAPTVPSRWLLRLDTVLKASGLDHLPVTRRGFEHFPAWAAALDRPARNLSLPPPEPRPPLAARPRKLSVTEIETWMRDPYAIYARRVLKLEALDPIDADPGAAERGEFIHAALDAFVAQAPSGTLPADSLSRLLAEGRAALGATLERPGVWAFWWPRFERVARWFLEVETGRRARLRASFTERKGRIEIAAPGGVFTLSAKADRIDLLDDGRFTVIDYKTGLPPSDKQVLAGISPQLPLEAAIVRAGGFEGIPPGRVEALEYWRLGGGDPPGRISLLKEPDALTDAAIAGLTALIARFDDPAIPYLARPRPDWSPRFSDYGHLARVAEWGGEPDP